MENLEILNIGQDAIDIKSIPRQEARKLEYNMSEFIETSLKNSKIKGGIFGSESIKFYKEEVSNETYTVKRSNNNGGDGGMSNLEKRVEYLEYQNRQMQEKLDDIKQQTFSINTKLDHTVSKYDISVIQNSITQTQNSITQTIQESLKTIPTQNDIKIIFDEVISNKKLTTETKVANLIMTSNKKLIKYIIGTGIACIGAVAAILRFL